MKFSVLLPTRNRLELLQQAIETVRRQDYEDWEIIVSDNASEQDIQGYISSLKDSRVKYFRTSQFVSVTENWNIALNLSCGEYVIMLGDDDCLMKNYFSSANSIIENFSSPDFIFSEAFLYGYPKVMPEFPNGFLKTFGNCNLWKDHDKPFLISKCDREALLRDTYNFKVVFAYNMQFATMRRSFIESLKINGLFFHSSYPDYYAMTLMMLKGETVVGCPYPLVTVGISPKSFGFYFFNKREKEGVKFLNHASSDAPDDFLKKIILPGLDMNTCWLLSLYAIKKNFDTACKFPIN